MVKRATEESVASIKDIANVAMRTDKVSIARIAAIISPLLKKLSDDPEVLSNYRPVSNVPFLSKLSEKAVACRLNR